MTASEHVAVVMGLVRQLGAVCAPVWHVASPVLVSAVYGGAVVPVQKVPVTVRVCVALPTLKAAQ